MNNITYNPANLTKESIPKGWQLMTVEEIDSFSNKYIRFPYEVRVLGAIPTSCVTVAHISYVKRDGCSYIRRVSPTQKVDAPKENPIITAARAITTNYGSSLDDKILIMQAAQAGAEIEHAKESSDNFNDFSAPKDNHWDFDILSYRVKPLTTIEITTLCYIDESGKSQTKQIKHIGAIEVTK